MPEYFKELKVDVIQTKDGDIIYQKRRERSNFQ